MVGCLINRVSKLKIELSKSSNRLMVLLFYKKLRYEIIRRYQFCKKDPWFSYPVSLSELLSLFKCCENNNIYIIGIDNSSLPDSLLPTYKSILDVEYCISGRECRILRYAIEKVITSLHMEVLCQ